jgi:hypothetical protein
VFLSIIAGLIEKDEKTIKRTFFRIPMTRGCHIFLSNETKTLVYAFGCDSLYVHTHTHTYIYIYIHTHTYTHTHTYIYIYMRRVGEPSIRT